MYIRTIIDEFGEDGIVVDRVDDSLTEDEINEFLHNKYGADKWFGYNIEPEINSTNETEGES